MKIAITADLHLRSREQRPERFAALENIFAQLRAMQAQTLIIAGDLFDAQFDNFAEFEALCRQPENRSIQVLIIPGNHDPNLTQAAFTAENVRVFSQPELVAPEPGGANFLLIPYRDGRSMGDVLSAFQGQLQPRRWVLVGHGDWMGNARAAKTYESGVYMPLSQRELDIFAPARAFLGHIHAPSDGPIVWYPGSPCGMDISETGRRRFLVYDPASNYVETRLVDTQMIFFNRAFTVYPVEDEAAALTEMLQSWIADWGLAPGERSKVRVRVRLNGYATDKNRLKQAVLSNLDGCQLESEPDLADVSVTTDIRRGQVVDLVRKKIAELGWAAGPDEPERDAVLLAAIKRVYGR
jgi:DNA repair exonuclease SbcCD nuclease subunit